MIAIVRLRHNQSKWGEEYELASSMQNSDSIQESSQDGDTSNNSSILSNPLSESGLFGTSNASSSINQDSSAVESEAD